MTSARARPWLTAFAILLSSTAHIALGATSPTAAQDPVWNGSPEQKVWGLMQMWGTVKHNLAFFDRVPDLDWDAVVQAAIPRVLAAGSQDEYDRRLNEVVARFHDGHTFVVAPSLTDGTEDSPPVEFAVIEDRIILVRSGDTDEIRTQDVRPGLELVAVGDGIPAKQVLQENALRYYPGSTRRGGEAFGMFLFLRGPKNSTVRLTLKDSAGRARTVALTRNSVNRDGSAFRFRIRDFSRLVESRTMAGGIAYLRLATSDDENVVGELDAALDRLDLGGLRGMVLDLRCNMGGDDRNAWPVLSRLIERPLTGSTWKTRVYRPAFASCGEPETWYQGEPVRIEPDVVVHPTVAGVRANRDEVLERAIEVLGDWDRYKGMAAYSTSR